MRRTELERALGGRTPSWGSLRWSEDEAFEAVVRGLRRDERSRAWLDTWARGGVATRGHRLASLLFEDPWARCVLEATGAGAWWDGSDAADRERRRRVRGIADLERLAPFLAGNRAVVGGDAAPDDPDGLVGASVGAHDAGGAGVDGRPARAQGPTRAGPCPPRCCPGPFDAAGASFAGPAPGGSRHLILARQALLRRCAAARAARSLAPGGSLAGRRAAVLVGVAVDRSGGSEWLARGLPQRTGAAWYDARCFAGASRVRGSGLLLATPENASCGLCGACPPPGADLASWVAAHPLALPGTDPAST